MQKGVILCTKIHELRDNKDNIVSQRKCCKKKFTHECQINVEAFRMQAHIKNKMPLGTIFFFDFNYCP